MLTLRGVSKLFAPTAGLYPLDLDVPAGDRLVLLGPSGSGKSTLLRLVAGLEEPDAGEVRINGKVVNRVPPHERGVAFVPQRPALYPHLTVRENLAVGAVLFPPPSGGRVREEGEVPPSDAILTGRDALTPSLTLPPQGGGNKRCLAKPRQGWRHGVTPGSRCKSGRTSPRPC